MQLWTTGNYHWYLKHEILAPTEGGKPGRFTSMSWHPEDSSRIILTTPCTSSQRVHILVASFYGQQRSFSEATSGTHSPHEANHRTTPARSLFLTEVCTHQSPLGVSISHSPAASILLTPFRTQNVPPPMSSFQLPLSVPPADAPALQARVPAHVCFSPNKDVLASLWETGYVALTDLRTRLGPGRGKIMDPSTVWRGLVGSEAFEYRQIAVLRMPDEAGDATIFAVLGSGKSQDGRDAIVLVSVTNGSVSEQTTIQLPQRNGRLVPSDEKVWWQSPEGELLERTCIRPLAIASLPDWSFSPSRSCLSDMLFNILVP